jgi:hypothetical protein
MKWPLVALAVVAICGCIASGAFAGFATTPFALNDGGPDAGFWRGSIPISKTASFGNNKVEALLEWAAFAPGDFSLYLAANAPLATDPSAPGEVTYAYQIVSVAAAVPGVQKLTVGWDSGDELKLGSVVPITVPLTPGTASSSSASQSTQAIWNFSPSIQALGSSGILAFSSIFVPELDNIQITSGLASAGGQAASIGDEIFRQDVPEPATITVVLLGMIGLGLRRRSR